MQLYTDPELTHVTLVASLGCRAELATTTTAYPGAEVDAPNHVVVIPQTAAGAPATENVLVFDTGLICYIGAHEAAGTIALADVAAQLARVGLPTNMSPVKLTTRVYRCRIKHRRCVRLTRKSLRPNYTVRTANPSQQIYVRHNGTVLVVNQGGLADATRLIQSTLVVPPSQ